MRHDRMRLLWVVGILVLMLLFCGCAAEANEDAPAIPPLVGQLTLSDGTLVPLDADSVRAVVRPEDLELLKGCANLRELDATGSVCYKELAAFEAANPSIQLRYTIDLGEPVAHDESDVTLKGPVVIDALLANLSYLKAPKSVVLGASPLSVEELAALRTLYESLESKPKLTVNLVLGEQVYSNQAESLDLSALSPDAYDLVAAFLPLYEGLGKVTLNRAAETEAAPTFFGDSLTLAQVRMLQQSNPDAVIDYCFNLYGRPFSTADTTMDLRDVHISDKNVEPLQEILPLMTRLAELNMIETRVSNKLMAKIRDSYPAVKVIWRVYFSRYRCRTDIVTLRASSGAPRIPTSELPVLNYCTDVEYLDIGHNGLRNINYVAYMPKLKAAILAIGYVNDITPLSNCPDMEYLELFNNRISDISMLPQLKNLRHLNLTRNYISDITPLLEMTWLERLWIGGNPISEEDKTLLMETLTNCQIDFNISCTGNGWRKHPRYELLKEQFDYENKSYYAKDWEP